MERFRVVGRGGVQRGFTLIEVLSAIALLAIILTLAAPALRRYWFVQEVRQAQTDVSSRLQELQQTVSSESNPIVLGARFTTSSGQWATLRYNLSTGVCTTPQSNLTLPGRMLFDASTSADAPPSTVACPLVTGAHRAVWFFPKGTATRARIVVKHPNVDRPGAVCVLPLTSRIYERTAEEPC